MHLAAILATGTPSGIGADVGPVQSRVSAEVGDEVQMTLSGHSEGVVVAKVTIQDYVGQRERGSDQVQQRVDHVFDPSQLRGQRGFGLGFVLTALGTSRAPLDAGRWPLFGGC